MEQARELTETRMSKRAAKLDRDATFPFDDFNDFRNAGFLGLCVPERFGGFGADLETYCLVSP